MRRTIVLLLSALALNVAAQTQPRKLEPIPEPPPPPTSLDESLEPQVTILKRGEDKVEEYRMNGKLYMLKVTPPHGVPYYMMDNAGDGHWTRHNTLDSGIRVPMWVLGTF